jgi:hypothetical protein
LKISRAVLDRRHIRIHDHQFRASLLDHKSCPSNVIVVRMTGG